MAGFGSGSTAWDFVKGYILWANVCAAGFPIIFLFFIAYLLIKGHG
jgi:hypothetical protein